MKIELKNNEEIKIECYSVQDGKTYFVTVRSDSFGRLTFTNEN